MRLTTSAEPDAQVTTRAELEGALRDIGSRGYGFAVLHRADRVWAQLGGSSSTGFVLEAYEHGAHLQSQRRDLSHAEAVAFLAAWLEGDEGWRTAIEWVPGPLDPASGPRGGWRRVTFRLATVVFVIALCLALLGGWTRERARAHAASFETTVGEVVSVKQVSARRGQYSHRATVRYEADGRTLHLSAGVPPSKAKVGVRVWVWFEARDPLHTATTTHPGANGHSIAWGLFGVAGVVALFALWFARDALRWERADRARTGSGGGSGEGGSPRDRLMRG